MLATVHLFRTKRTLATVHLFRQLYILATVHLFRTTFIKSNLVSFFFSFFLQTFAEAVLSPIRHIALNVAIKSAIYSSKTMCRIITTETIHQLNVYYTFAACN